MFTCGIIRYLLNKEYSKLSNDTNFIISLKTLGSLLIISSLNIKYNTWISNHSLLYL